jgi:hypothetical protein
MKETIQFGRLEKNDAGQHPDADQLNAFMEQALPAHEREVMLAHLAVCTECRATVAMALPDTKEVTPVIEEPRRRPPRFAGWGLAWLAGATLAAVVFAVYLRHEAGLRNQKNAAEQVAVARAPEEMGRPKTVPKEKSLEEVKKSAENGAGEGSSRDVEARAKGKAGTTASSQALDRPAQPRGFAAQQGQLRQAPMLADKRREGMMRPVSPAVAAGDVKTQIPPAPTTETEQAIVAGAATENSAAPIAGQLGVVDGAAGGIAGNALKKAEVAAALRAALPSGLPVLSMATKGRQVLAIDARNGVFLSTDGGANWRVVPVRWAGRAVKADLVSYGGGGTAAAGGGMTSFASTSRVVEPLQSVNAQKQAAPASAAVAPVPRQMQTAGAAALPPAQAQSASPTTNTGAKLKGTVTDLSGAAVQGATVTVTDTKGQTSRATVTDRDGGYLLDGLAPGTYDMKTQAQGFAAQTASAVPVKEAQPNVQNVALTVGAASQTVTVDASQSAAVETDSMMLSPAAARRAKTKPAAVNLVPLVFEIMTDNGDHWTSADGMNWQRE